MATKTKKRAAPKTKKNAKAAKTTRATKTTAPVRREGTKQAQLIEMLSTPKGATNAEIMKRFGWQSHTVHGALAGALKKKLGLKVSSTPEERGRVYRIEA